MFRLVKESGDTANFSVILPGECNAKCSFCFWTRSGMESPMYAQQLGWFLSALGDKVTQVSLTGGEPTLSPVFDDVINVLSLSNKVKVILTTNGAKLKEKLPALKGVVQHINISRHAVGDEENALIFGGDLIPTKAELADICDVANSMNIDVTINKVVPPEYDDMDEFQEYIAFIKEIGASSLALRKDYSVNTLDNVPLESNLGRAGIKRDCPVCATNSYLYKGVPIHFKMSLEEPSTILPYIYEFIYHPDGNLTEDWAGKLPVEFAPIANPKPIQQERIVHVSSGGCGQSSMRSGC